MGRERVHVSERELEAEGTRRNRAHLHLPVLYVGCLEIEAAPLRASLPSLPFSWRPEHLVRMSHYLSPPMR